MHLLFHFFCLAVLFSPPFIACYGIIGYCAWRYFTIGASLSGPFRGTADEKARAPVQL